VLIAPPPLPVYKLADSEPVYDGERGLGGTYRTTGEMRRVRIYRAHHVGGNKWHIGTVETELTVFHDILLANSRQKVQTPSRIVNLER
jgi:hypothetical protein